jgi:hypothetical protein
MEKKKNMKTIALAFLSAALALCAASAVADPVIYRTYIDVQDIANRPLVIEGENFGSATASVLLGGQALTVLDWSPNQIRAKVPVSFTQPGNYLVVVSLGNGAHQSAQFVADLGAATNLGTVAGQVLACGVPAPRALVYIQGRSFVAFTNASGGFYLNHVPAGDHELVVEVQGYTPVSFTVTVLHGRLTLASLPVCTN